MATLPPALIQSLKDITVLWQSDKMSGVGVNGITTDLQFESFPGVHMGHVSVYYNGSMIVLSGFKGYKVIIKFTSFIVILYSCPRFSYLHRPNTTHYSSFGNIPKIRLTSKKSMPVV